MLTSGQVAQKNIRNRPVDKIIFNLKIVVKWEKKGQRCLQYRKQQHSKTFIPKANDNKNLNVQMLVMFLHSCGPL